MSYQNTYRGLITMHKAEARTRRQEITSIFRLSKAQRKARIDRSGSNVREEINPRESKKMITHEMCEAAIERFITNGGIITRLEMADAPKPDPVASHLIRQFFVGEDSP